ncbi:MAG: GNAT family N-acetyltransferase [Halobacteriales archaeon]|nr:GNAT family N-acetyltransferase [Halobacteriales archaeon]
MEIRGATSEEIQTVRSIFDVAMLQVPDLPRMTVLVAAEANRVLGGTAVETDGERGQLCAIAVRPRRRGQGIGTALVEEATDRWDPVVAEFNERVCPFYESLDFAISPTGNGRFHGVCSDQRLHE